MRIVQVIDNLFVGGAQSLLVTFAQQALDHDHELTLVVMYVKSGTPVEEELQKLGVRIYFLPGSSLFTFSRVQELVKILRSERAEVVHTHLMYSNILGALAGWWARVPVVASLHNEMNEPGFANQVKVRLETLALRLASARVVAVGNIVKQSQGSRFRNGQVEVISNAVQIPDLPSQEEKDAMRRELVDKPDLPILVSIGRLAQQKGLPDLLESVHTLRKSFPDFRLVLIGEGSYRPAVEAKIDELSLHDCVVMTGQRTDAVRLMSACDIYVSASYWEGLPVAVLEAMASGLPVVATEVGELPYMIKSGESGCLVPPRQPDVMASTLLNLLKKPERLKKMGASARKYVVENHHAKAWADRMMQLYRQAQLKEAVS